MQCFADERRRTAAGIDVPQIPQKRCEVVVRRHPRTDLGKNVTKRRVGVEFTIKIE